jgi:hypothetical protein
MEGNQSRRRGKEEGGLTREATMSAMETEKEDAASRELGRQHLLGSAQAERGERVTRAGANGPRGRVGLPDRKRGGEVNSFFFLFPFQLFQSIFK